MNWFMDILGSVWGGGMFCAIVTMGINVRVLIPIAAVLLMLAVPRHRRHKHRRIPSCLEYGT
jgi:hypothetical protein